MEAEDNTFPKITRLGHVAISSPDPPALARFYQTLLGLQIIGQAHDGSSVFLSARPEEESHEFVIFRDPIDRHTAFKVATLDDLKQFHRALLANEQRVLSIENHGVSLSIYFHDLDRNLVEVYWTTGRDYPQPFSAPVDLTLPNDDLVAIIAAMQPDASPT